MGLFMSEKCAGRGLEMAGYEKMVLNQRVTCVQVNFPALTTLCLILDFRGTLKENEQGGKNGLIV